MNVLMEIVIAILAGYLAVTNFLAHQIMDILPSTDTEEVAESEEAESFLSTLPSKFGAIPDILLSNKQPLLVQMDLLKLLLTSLLMLS